ncbi:MAG: hypothetical protein MI747_16075 [Desulfobacterales bacterium]|nr:hypothetical protein [Desulfobacterales bacterium]
MKPAQIRTNPFQGQGETQGRPTVDPADAHALKSHLQGPSETENHSSLFGGRAKAPAREDDLESRLAQYQSQRGGDGMEKSQTLPTGLSVDDGGAGGGEFDESDPGEELAQDVAEQILVTHRDFARGEQEVRIKIKSSILKDGHIHLLREDNRLDVKLLSRERASVHVLVEARDRLAQILKQNFKGEIVIQVIHITDKGRGETVT